MTEKHYFDDEPQTEIELEEVGELPGIHIENLKIKNLYVTVNMPHCWGGGEEDE